MVVHVDAAVLADPDQPGQSVLEDGRARFRGNVPAPGVRREPGGDAARRGRARWWRSGPGPGRFPRRCGARSTIGTGAAASRAAASAFGQGHHLRHWAQGGPTTLSNLALLCRRHHRAVHEEGYQVEREPDGALRFRRPDGRLAARGPAAGRGARRSGPGPPAQHDAQGLRLHARTAFPAWLGERLDVGWAIDVLHPLAR